MATQTGTKKTTIARGRTLALVYGSISYLIFLFSALYAIGFVGDLIVPKTIDTGQSVPFMHALIVDALLLSLFAIQHSVMARPAFKQWWTTIIPQSIERSTYVLFTSMLLLLLYWQWLPIPGTIWNVEHTTGGVFLLGLYFVGWLIVFLSTFLINHFDLFGLRQVYVNWRAGKYTSLSFKTPSLYKPVRHPMMLGFLIAFWATPHMTVSHLIFSLATTAYILVGIHLEERDLLAFYGETYRRYQQRVSMLLPLPKKRVIPAERKSEDERETLSSKTSSRAVDTAHK
jgi:protein-S-isoprenylcysteine O-methyltransferase Ste14